MLKPGDTAPSFRLASTGGREVSSSKLKRKKFVLYFYPKDDTPGCTREACDFRDNLGRIRREGVEVFGVSKDSLASHARFREKYGLPFALLSDDDNGVAKAYGAFGEKSMYGRKILGTIRSTFLVDEKGKIEALWSPVKVDGHVDRVLTHLSGAAAPAKAKKKTAKKKK
ncbi:MAG: thioredoxin-dependent thiol peroxidase [Vicinamibacteria bacterium]